MGFNRSALEYRILIRLYLKMSTGCLQCFPNELIEIIRGNDGNNSVNLDFIMDWPARRLTVPEKHRKGRHPQTDRW
jgi:hypothetical protein